MKRTSCSACGSPDLDTFLNLGASPVADAYTATPDEDSPRYPLEVAVCGKCHLVQLLEVVPTDVLFGTGYSFYSSASAQVSTYHKAYADGVLASHAGLVERAGVVEVGSNDGDLLRHFRNYRHLGVDPSTGPGFAARERGCDVVMMPFGLDIADRIRNDRGPTGVVIANHVLAHVEDVNDCLRGIAALMDDQSVAIVEVQYLPDLLVNNAFDLVYHEHRNFFSLTTLGRAAAGHSLFVVDAQLTDRQGGSLRATLAKGSNSGRVSDRVKEIRASERWLDDFSAYAGMQGRAERIRTRLRDLVDQQNGTVAVYGAPAKATTLLNFCGFTVAELPWCLDPDTPAKHGRHIPGTGIPIVGENPQPPDAMLLAVWNYAGSIIRRYPHFTEQGHWLVPFPAPVVL